MTCDEMLKALSEYVDGNVDSEPCREFQKHLAGCGPCQVVVDNVRQTITVYKNGLPYEMPSELCRNLRNVLKAKWTSKFAPSSE